MGEIPSNRYSQTLVFQAGSVTSKIDADRAQSRDFSKTALAPVRIGTPALPETPFWAPKLSEFCGLLIPHSLSLIHDAGFGLLSAPI
jgi:hypothetical protein